MHGGAACWPLLLGWTFFFCKSLLGTDHPDLFGIPWPSALPDCCVLSLDETPLPYCPKMKTMGDKSCRRNALPQDKRQITPKFSFFLKDNLVLGTPILSKDGRLILFQFIWRGVTKRVIPRMECLDERMVHTFAAKKCQTKECVIIIFQSPFLPFTVAGHFVNSWIFWMAE